MLEAKVQRQVDGRIQILGMYAAKILGLDQLKMVPGDQSVRVGLVEWAPDLAPANGASPDVSDFGHAKPLLPNSLISERCENARSASNLAFSTSAYISDFCNSPFTLLQFPPLPPQKKTMSAQQESRIDWDRHRTELHSLYLTEDRTLEDIVTHMKEAHDLCAR